MADFSFPQIGDVDLVEVYEFYDEPVLFSCRDRTDLLYLAVLSEETASHKTWLLTALSARRFSQLRAGALDLHSAFTDAERGQVYKARLPRTPDGTPAVEWVPSADLTRKELPLAGERLDPAEFGPVRDDSTSPSLRADGEARTAEPKDDAAPRPSTVLLDNRAHGRVFDALEQALAGASDASILTSGFSIFAFEALHKALQRVGSTRVLLSPTAPEAHVPPPAGSLLGDKEERRYRNQLTAPHAARSCSAWIEQQVEVAGINAPVPHSLYIVSKGKSRTAIQGSSSFTAPGLGLVPTERLEMNTQVTGAIEVEGLRAYYDGLWNDRRLTRDAKTRMLAELERIYAPKSAQTIYFATLFVLFQASLERLEEEQILKTKTGVRDTLVWRKLYRFQRDGVLGAIDKIERYNGCIIADSVGLGKTFEALAIIKYYELRNDRVLVLCPKKLRENWTLYTVNDKRNIFASDRFNYDVLNHTDLTRRRGKSGEINLETINWGNYDLVVIDESHNFRNNPPKKDGLTRYKRLMREIIRSGVKTRVLMLSATPVNSRMNDLKNQVAFITEGVDDALDDAGLVSIEQTLRKAQGRFNQWLKLDAKERTTASLLESLNFDYFKLLDLLTIARSRKHIEKYYDLAEIGEFPRRAKPINVRADIDTADLFPPLREVNRDIRRLSLSAYAPMRYVLPEKVEEYSRRYDIEVAGGRSFRQLDREESLIHLMRVNLLKRMESSIHSFAQTVEKLLGKVDHLIERIEKHDVSEVEELSIEDIDLDNEDFVPYLVGAKVKVLLQDVDLVRWKQDLQEDEQILTGLLREARQVDVKRDEKLRSLKDLVSGKAESPINPGNRKVLIFTAFADTADYLYENIAAWAMQEHGLHSAIVTGRSGRNKTNLKGMRTDLGSVLASFSPISKEREKIDAEVTTEIDLLIATDCISEGQNLQDCDYLVNYDIHWNPVRIIQRFGRIDRLGSRNDTIQLVNFWPNMELDEYINLEARVSGRMVLLDISATGEENVIEESQRDQMNDLAYRKRQFETLQEQVIDIEDLGGGISITDLTLNDFKMDLSSYLKHHQEELATLPLGAFSVATDDELLEDSGIKPGAFFCLRSENANVTVDSTYALSPHFLVFVGDDGQVILNFTQTRRFLDLVKKLALGRSQPDAEAHQRFADRTRGGADMAHYRTLLERAVAAVSGKAEEKGVESLFHRGGTAMSRDSHRGLDDFEVVAYLAVLEAEGG
ncbi:MAG: helicase [Deltaproteobacteria bacterium]|nr:helicase [Deltaproteobacteria bacterium]